jgi:hypothetical protein
VTVRGTLLSFYRLKDGKAGKLVRSYTLQHAEVGLAADAQHTVLVPQTRLAHLIPIVSRRKAWKKDPDLFKAVKQHILRLRIETDQIILADSYEETIIHLIDAISAGIDVSHAIDERSIPRQRTVPRRRRRPRPRVDGDLNDPALLAEQERILREMYPGFADHSPPRPELTRTTTAPAREEDEIDLSVMREDTPPVRPSTAADDASDSSRPPVSRQETSTSSVESVMEAHMIYESSPTNFDSSGKWAPPHQRTAAQIQRYTRRCLPILLAESVRASDIIIANGKRVKINWRNEMLEEWQLSPPSYKSHAFKQPQNANTSLTRAQSTNSQAPSTTSGPRDAADDRIEPIDTSLANDVAKSATVDKDSPTTTQVPQRPSLHDLKLQRAHNASNIHGVMVCF